MANEQSCCVKLPPFTFFFSSFFFFSFASSAKSPGVSAFIAFCYFFFHCIQNDRKRKGKKYN